MAIFDEAGNLITKKSESDKVIPEKEVFCCQYCDKEWDKKVSKSQHERWCNKNPNKREYRKVESIKKQEKKEMEKDIMKKKCAICKRILPLNADNFYRSKDKKDGFMSKCKECRKEYLNELKLKKKTDDKDTENLNNEESIYEWVKTLPKEKRILLDPNKISNKIKEELFGKK